MDFLGLGEAVFISPALVGLRGLPALFNGEDWVFESSFNFTFSVALGVEGKRLGSAFLFTAAAAAGVTFAGSVLMGFTAAVFAGAAFAGAAVVTGLLEAVVTSFLAGAEPVLLGRAVVLLG